jgi:hypothetical protein
MAVPKRLTFSTSLAFLQRTHRVHRRRAANLDDWSIVEELLELSHGAHSDNPASLHQGEAVAVLGFVEIMSCDEYGDTAGRHVVDQTPEAPPRYWVHSAGRLVEKEDWRLVKDCAPEGQALSPATRQVTGKDVLPALQASHLQHEPSPLPPPLAVEAVEAREELDVLADGQALVQERIAATCNRCAV